MLDLRATVRAAAPLAMPLAYLAFTLLVFWYKWTPIEGAQLTWRWDPVHQYWGDLLFQQKELSSGHLPLWNPYDRGGYPLYGDPQPGLLYPLNWPILAIGALTGGLGYELVEAKVIAHWMLGTVGMHLLLRRRGVPEPACYIGALVFAFSAPAIRYGGSALNWSFMWLPIVLLAVEALSDRVTYRRAALLGTSVAMTLLAGAPAVFFYVLLVAIPYGVVVMWGRIRASLLPLLAAAGVALLWVLPLVLSNLELLPHSVREERDLSFIASSVFEPAHFLNVFVPNIGGENIFYGLLPLAAFGALVAVRHDRRGIALAFVGGAGALLALGEHSTYLQAMASALEPFSMFRRAHRYLYVLSAAVALGAGLGVGYLLTLDDEARRRALARRFLQLGAGVTGVLGMGTVVSVAAGEHGEWARGGLAWGMASAAVATVLLRGLVAADGRRRTGYAWAAVVVVALDLWGANVEMRQQRLGPKPNPRHDHLVTEQFRGVEEGAYRIYDRGHIRYRPGVRLGIRDFGGYEEDPLALSRYADYRLRALENPILLAHANVRYYIRGDRRPRLTRDLEVVQRTGDNVYEIESAAPAVYYVPAPELASDATEALDALTSLAPGEEAVIEDSAGVIPAGPEDAPAAQGAITRLEPNRLTAEISTPGPGLVVVAEAYYPAFSATVDGEPVDIVPANAMFRGVPVSSGGRHVIEMELSPTRFWASLPAYAAAFLLLSVIAGSALWRRVAGRARAGAG